MYNYGVKANCSGVRKGSWTDEEDNILRKCIDKYGEGNWHRVPLRAGLNRCRKSCRLRWTNYLKPNIKRGQFSEEEVDLIIRLHKLLGNRWSLIAGRIPGRTANDVKNYWNTHLHKKFTPSTLPPKLPGTFSTNISIKDNNVQQSYKKQPTLIPTSRNITPTLQPQIIRPRPWTLPRTSSTAMKRPEDVTVGQCNMTSDNLTENQTLGKFLEEDGDDNAKWWKNLVEMYEKEENLDHLNRPTGDGLGYHEPNVWPTSSSEVPDLNLWDDGLWNFDVSVPE